MSEAEMAAPLPEEAADPEIHIQEFRGELELRDAAKREIGARIVPWHVVADGKSGLEYFKPGAFAGIDPGKVKFMRGHRNANGDPGEPVGRGVSLEEREDGAHMVFRVSKTAAGDELLTLAGDHVLDGVSVAYHDVPDGVAIERHHGRSVRAVSRADLRAVATTWLPTWDQSRVLFTRSKEGEPAPMAETTVAPAAGDPPSPPAAPPQIVFPTEQFTAALTQIQERSNEASAKFLERLEKLEERSRTEILIPARADAKKGMPRLIDWAEMAVKMLSGERVRQQELHERDLDDVVTPDNPGLVPEAFVNDLIGIVNKDRPFLQSTREIPAPDTGTSISVPVLSQRSTAAVQANSVSGEKTDIESTAMKVTAQPFEAITVAGGADISIQMIRRASRSFLALLFDDLGAALGVECDTEAVNALIDAGPTAGGELDPEDIELGQAWKNSMAAIRRAPDTLWLSSDAVKAFIDAKNDGSNEPLYWALRSSIQAGTTQPGGDLSALNPVYVPALDTTAFDAIVGPSSGFAWAEDGSFTLEADIPSKLGRDIALATILFLVPRYPTAFTTYYLPGSGA